MDEFVLTAEEKERANYDLITDLSRKVGDLKGYDYGYSLPKCGMMIIQHGGVNFLATFEPLSLVENCSLAQELRNHEHVFRAKEEQLAKEIQRERSVEDGK